ncbi:response regulator [uncultured Alteromonas sp.]|jgi:DNA-binding response OmpR family regulator|uniref:response regulator n=1 Tax=uncultured Alteromonas sp. TaxID=179113 RepID=UPI0025FB182A|nr:response regulator [uncultured Alteromonas sp.]
MNLKLARQTRVLVIDDQVLAKGYLKYSLEELGFQNIEYADRVSTALTYIRRNHYDLIVCSYDLKNEQDGYFLYDQLKEHNELPPSTAFVFISADTTADIVHSIVELQPDDFLAKPFTVRELDRRLGRLLTRKQVLKPVYHFIEQGSLDKALLELENFLTEPRNSEFFPLALKLKGELLLACGHYDEAREFYQAIINVQNFTWAQLGLIRSFISLDLDEEAEKLVIELALKQDSMIAAYDLLAALQIKHKEFEDALESVEVASEISPRNIHRHTKALDLSRLTHDYESQFEAAKKIVRIAKNSIHDKPEIYLNVARAGIDFAMTADEEHTKRLIKQSTEYLKQLKSNFPKADIDDQLKVIDARLLYLEDEVDNAKALLDQLSDDAWETESIEGLLDKAKAFHEVGFQEHALNILDLIERRCNNDPAQSNLFLQYVQQEKTEKAEIKLSPKELNNSAVNQYQRGDLEKALQTFRQAFTIMPKNPSIALNLLQAAAINLRETNNDAANDSLSAQLIHNCLKAIESGKLTEEQEQRYQRVKKVLKDLT